jgi:hypothetical protein
MEDMTMDPVSEKIASLEDWRGELLARIRQVIMAADPRIEEDVKWRKASNPLGVPTWSHGGIICTGETYKDKVKLTFMKGSSLRDNAAFFNVPADGVRRANDLRRGDELDEAQLRAVVLEAIEVNSSTGK